jgi:hypothetical protein
MAQQNIDFGTFPDDPSADAIRTAFQKVQQNFTEVYTGLTSTAVRSVNRTAGPGITVNSPTGNVVVTANIASVSISSVTLKVGTSPNPVTNNATYTSYSQTLYIEIPDNLSVANISASGNITANGNLIASNANLGNAATANYFIGDGTNLTNVTSATSNTANTAGTVTQNAQPNITSVGTLSSVSVSGNVTSGNANLGNAVTGNFFIGSGANLTSLAGANVTGEVANANYASYANVAYSVSAGNISGTVNLANFATTANAVAGANVSGEVSFAATANAVAGANVSGAVANATYANSTNSANSATTAGTVTTADQPNITSTGTLASLSVSGNANVGNLGTAGVITASGTITGGNLATAGTLSVGGNTTLGNLSVTGVLNAGDITVGSISNGTSIVDIIGVSGDVTTSVAGNANILVVTGTGANINGYANVTGNISAGNVTATTFTGALSGLANSATTAATVTTNAQPNITSIGTLSNLTVSGNSNLGAVGNVRITGSAGFLQNDGNGVLSFTSPITQIIPGAANALLYSDGANNISASGNIKFNDPQLDITGNLSVTGNANVGNIGATNIVGTLTTNAQLNITTVGTLTSLALSGNLNSDSNIVLNNANANISTLGNMTANVYFGNGSQLTGVTAATASTVTTNAQPNITSTGTLSSLSVSGNANVGNIGATNGVFTNVSGNGSALTAITGANVSGAVSFATTANSVAVANISGIGNIATVNLDGNASNILYGNGVFAVPSGAVANANYSNFAGTAYSVSGANVTGTVANATFATSAGSATTAGTANSVAGANVTGTVANATFATSAGTANSVAGANVTGTVANATFATSAGSATTAGTANSVAGANVTGTVANATFATSADSATTAGTVTTTAQGNITSVGTLTSLSVSGTATIGTVQTTTLTTGANTTAGTITGNFSLSAGSRLNATYADLAEYYAGSEQIEPGTVVEFGGEHEVQICNSYMSTLVAGIVTTDPAYLMNSEMDCLYPVAVALQGRVPSKVIGPIKRGDMMVSTNNGYAISCASPTMGTVLGKALKDFDGTTGIIEIMVGRT